MPACMKIQATSGGTVSGDSSFNGHTGWINIDGFEFGERPSYGASLINAGIDPEAAAMLERTLGGGAAGRKKDLFGGAVIVRKRADIATPGLMNWLKHGDARKVHLHGCTDHGVAYYQLTLLQARLQEYKIDGEDANGNPTERMQVTWAGFELVTEEWDERNTARGSRSPFKFERPKIEAPPPAPADALGSPALMTGFDDPSTGGAKPELSALANSLSKSDPRAPGPQRRRQLEIDELNGKEFDLHALRGEEGLSRLYHFELDLTSSDDAITAADVVGQPVAFRIKDVDDIDAAMATPDRNFHGRVRRFWAGDLLDGGTRRYRIEVVPWLWLLTKRSDCRVFQKKTVVQIIEQVFSDAGFSDFEKNSVTDEYPQLEYCVQYRETDFEFVSRLLEEAGILYFFRHETSSHKLVLADKATVHTEGEDPQVVHSSGENASKCVYSWERGYDLVAKKALLRDYNYLTPSDDLSVEQATTVDLPNTDALQLFDYPGDYTKKSDGNNVAKARIQAEEALHDLGVGKGNWDALAVGDKFTFEHHEVSAEEGQSYTVVSIQHEARQVSDEAGIAVDYHSTFSAAPVDVLLRPQRVHRRPVVHGPQTALVVGPQGEEIATDKYGRIKVQFHWDRKGKKDENSSCWIRVAQPLAGKGWGAIALPRIGQEVVVEFLEGDPDRPLCTGSLYNESFLPAELPAKKNVTLLRTRSTKEGTDEHFNELAFDDTKDSEKVLFHAQKDFERVVEHDDLLTIGKDDEGSRTVTIEKDSTLTINKGDRVETLTEGSDTLTIEQGDRTIEVKTGKETVTIKGDRSVTIQSGKDTLEVTSGDQEVKVGGKTNVEVSSGFTLKVTAGKVSIDAPQGIELKAGSSSMKLGAAGVVIKGVTIKIESNIETQIKGLMVTAQAQAMLKAKGGVTMLG